MKSGFMPSLSEGCMNRSLPDRGHSGGTLRRCLTPGWKRSFLLWAGIMKGGSLKQCIVWDTLWHAFGRWNNQSNDPNNWEIFTRINRDNPGKANVGNIHFPPNGTSDYDYSNSTNVITYADNWKRFPYLLNQTRTINCSEWGCGQLGYMRWWFSHIPRFTGVTDSILNDWWYYALDYYKAVELAHELQGVGVKENLFNSLPGDFKLYQNYPNPFNPSTDIRFTIPELAKVRLKVYDILGRLVAKLLDDVKSAGTYDILWDGKNMHDQKLASGIYFYRLETDNFNQTKKLVLLK